jgi:hypothetical protein
LLGWISDSGSKAGRDPFSRFARERISGGIDEEAVPVSEDGLWGFFDSIGLKALVGKSSKEAL